MARKLASSPAPTRIARAYVRVSDVRGRDESTTRSEFISPDLQLSAGRQVSALYGWEFDETASLAHMDLDQSASRKAWTKRRGLMQHLADARAGKFHVLVFYKLARLARNVREGLEIWDAFEEAGTQIYIVKESIDTGTPVGRLLRSILLAVAEMQAEDIADYAEAMHQRRARKGLPPPTLPHWIRADGDGMELDPDAATILRRLIDLRLSGLGYTRIAATLNAEGHRMNNGKPWTHLRVHSLLSGDAALRLAGVSSYHLATGETIRTEHAYPAVATPEEIAVLQGISAALRPAYRSGDHPAPSTVGRGRSLTTPYLLSSLLHCAVCGAPLKAAYGGASNDRAYRCHRSREDRTRHPDGQGLLLVAEPVEDAVLRALRLLLTASPPPLAKGKAEAPSRKLRVRTVADIEGEMSRLVALRIAQRIKESVYLDHHARLEKELADLESADSKAEEQEAARLAAVAALEAEDWRGLCLYVIERADAPITIPGLEYIGAKAGAWRGGSGRLRRCVRITLRLSLPIGQTFLIPIYRRGYTGTFEMYDADGVRLSLQGSP